MLPEDSQRALLVLFFKDKSLGESLLSKPSVSTIPSVAAAVLDLSYEYFVDPGRAVFQRQSFREIVREIAVSTGRTLLGVMSEEEVRALVELEFSRRFGP
jgi:hypothetical protein